MSQPSPKTRGLPGRAFGQQPDSSHRPSLYSRNILSNCAKEAGLYFPNECCVSLQLP